MSYGTPAKGQLYTQLEISVGFRSSPVIYNFHDTEVVSVRGTVCLDEAEREFEAHDSNP
jgi:hypothetical protein